MPSSTPLTDAINALTTYANETTGASDTTLSDAVGSLVAGYGGGGGVDLDDFFNSTAPTGSVALSTATTLRGWSFAGNTGITSISAPNITRLGECDFKECSNLVSVTMPNLEYAATTNIADSGITRNQNCYAFQWCHKLGSVHLPKLKKMGKGMFYQVASGESTYNAIIVLPAVEYVGELSFRQGKFKAVDIGGSCESIGSDGFYQGTYDVVILRNTTLVQALSRDAVRYITNLYVPSALVASYATASNWVSDAANRTVTAIEGSQYEHYYADGTPISS